MNHVGLDLLVIQPTSLCNLDCTYCYVPDRLNSQRLAISLLEKLLHAVRCSSLAAGQEDLKILWHAGEPLAAGIDYFREALAVSDRILGDQWRVHHSIQTNGTLITSGWCELFRTKRVSIGVSLDGPAELHDANRKTRGGGGSFLRVMRGLELLRAHDVPISVLSVLSSKNIGHPDEMFYFFVANGLYRVAFNVEEIEGPNVNSSLLHDGVGLAGARSRYAAFMGRLAQLNKTHGWPLKIREFANLAQLIQKRRQFPNHIPLVREQRAGSIVTMTRDGSIYSWSPELASGDSGASGRFSLGNIRDVETVDEFFLAERAQEIQREIDRGVEMCSKQCGYFAVCGGGSPANKFYEQGTFAVTETLKCALQTQELVEVVLSTFSGNQPSAQTC